MLQGIFINLSEVSGYLDFGSKKPANAYSRILYESERAPCCYNT